MDHPDCRRIGSGCLFAGGRYHPAARLPAPHRGRARIHRSHLSPCRPQPGPRREFYAQHCVPCHGEQGKGDGPQASRLSNPVAPIGTPELARQSTPAQWFAIVSQGNFQKFMPGFAGILSDGERWDVLAYVYSLSSPSEQIAQGKEIYTQQCVPCHGEQGKGDGPKAASLSTKPIDLTDQAKLADVSLQDLFDVVTNGAVQIMPAFKDRLSDDQRWAVTSYLRTFTLGAGQPDLQAQAAVTPPASGTQEITPIPASTASGPPRDAAGSHPCRDRIRCGYRCGHR